MPETGERLAERWTPSQADFDLFAQVSGDDNPIHVDPAFSAATRFGRAVAHGMLLYGRLWGMLQRRFPGARQAGQVLMFPNPAYAGEELGLEAVVEASRADGTTELAVAVRRIADGALVLTGRAQLAMEKL